MMIDHGGSLVMPPERVHVEQWQRDRALALCERMAPDCIAMLGLDRPCSPAPPECSPQRHHTAPLVGSVRAVRIA